MHVYHVHRSWYMMYIHRYAFMLAVEASILTRLIVGQTNPSTCTGNSIFVLYMIGTGVSMSVPLSYKPSTCTGASICLLFCIPRKYADSCSSCYVIRSSI